MEQNFKVSVIIPFYNLGDFIDETVTSVLNQTYKNLEVIIIDDGSTEVKSIKKLKKYKDFWDKRVTLYRTKNKGLAAARNFGISRSTGKYICCIDADDKYCPEFVADCSRFLEENPTYGFVTTWFQPFGLINGPDTTVQIKKNTPEMLVKNVPHVASMFRRKVWVDVSGYDENMKRGKQDWDFWLSAVERGYDWEVINKVLFLYRIRENSMLRSNTSFKDATYEYILKKHELLLKNIDIIEVLKAASDVIYDYDQTINRLNKENKALKDHFRNLKITDFFRKRKIS